MPSRLSGKAQQFQNILPQKETNSTGIIFPQKKTEAERFVYRSSNIARKSSIGFDDFLSYKLIPSHSNIKHPHGSDISLSAMVSKGVFNIRGIGL